MPPETTSPAIPDLPALDPGIQLLEVDGKVTGPLHTLVVDHAAMHRGPTYWVDAHGYARTHSLAQVAPEPRLLDRIQVARGFTPFQHYSLIESLVETVDTDTSLLVLPALDGMYRDEALRQDERCDMLVRVIANLAGVARDYDLPVLVTRTQCDDLTAPIEAAAVETIQCKQTRMGPRFIANEFETLVYPVGNGQVQTTLAFWENVLIARLPLYKPTPTTPEVTANGAY